MAFFTKNVTHLDNYACDMHNFRRIVKMEHGYQTFHALDSHLDKYFSFILNVSIIVRTDPCKFSITM